MAGNPPAVCSATPGVLKKKVSVITYVAVDIAAPNAEKSGLIAPSMRVTAVDNSRTPII
jgi:hypothetical protein